MKSTMRAFQRFNILICFLVFLVYMQKLSTILVGERCVTFQQSMLEIHIYVFIQEPKTSSESLEKYLNEME